MTTPYAGRCLCKQLSFKARGEPQWVAYCHCASCRRHTGCPVTCFVNYRLDDVEFAGERTLYPSSPGVTRSHCAVCGTAISYETARRPGEIDLYLNAFDEPQLFRPGGHAFFREHIPWFDTRDDLPRN